MSQRYMRSQVYTRLTVACEILYPKHEEIVPLPEDGNLKDLFWFAKHYVRDAIRNGADSARVDVYEVYDQKAYDQDPLHFCGKTMMFRTEAQDTYYHEGERVSYTYASNAAYALLGLDY